MECTDINYHVLQEQLEKQTKDMHSLVARRNTWLEVATQEEYRIQGGIEFINQCMKISDRLIKIEAKVYRYFDKANKLSCDIEADFMGRNTGAKINKLGSILDKAQGRMDKLASTLVSLENEVGIKFEPETNSADSENN